MLTEKKAESRLRGADHLESCQIRCTFCNDILTLYGLGSNGQLRQIALEVIKDLEESKSSTTRLP
jgi:hypothetical protein